MIVDCDGQMSLTRFYFPDLDPDNTTTVADVLLGESEAVWSDNTVPVDSEGKVTCCCWTVSTRRSWAYTAYS